MKIINNSQENIDERKQELAELSKRANDGNEITLMLATPGWKLLENLYMEQLEIYKAEMLLGCRDWDHYNELRGKAAGINLLLTDIEDFKNQGEDAEEELKDPTLVV